ncbi:VWA domain-containing protein [Dactylosporangium matsuzakiense]|uniref:Mg-protoporphyrin IX chelatase n=1 Tax=Dactylosporangium matsuzakiense TaxID=53360 RepID=A0A9W6NHX9_9ACTN|nr:VWA domain-containing protein [Dactylosporangium matsuzakiense]UWZ47224.1 VWA domain-containing protein [Dactylosporangium matsuzakiense]GLK98329.1 magnesium chelatase [Dactylosporangium matsuzakiense]
MTPPYPFSAVVGLPDLRLALLLTAVSPAIGGVLVRGEKGTAKSTVVRALAALLPDIDVVAGCRFACDPAAPDAECPDGPHTVDTALTSTPDDPGLPTVTVGVELELDAVGPGFERRRSALVELPVGATEDRVVGTLDLQRALGDGVKAYEPGLLAAAHRGVLYVDEVNLLPDHLVDLLLDAAAMGRAHVERDGVSVKHAARFLLVGTMNPEEGEPRPQLVDRFGLVVGVAAPQEAAPRAEVVRRRLAYELDPAAFAARYVADDAALAERIVTARARLATVALPDAELDRIARICLAYRVDGLRADIVVARTAVALAAWQGRTVVTKTDVRDAARLALPHRRRRDPLDPPGADRDRLEEVLEQEAGADPDDDPPGGPPPSDPDPEPGPSDKPDGSAAAPPAPLPPGPAEQSFDPPTQRPPVEPSDGGLSDRSDSQDGSGSSDISDMPGVSAPGQLAFAGLPYRPKLLTIAGRANRQPGSHAGRRSPALSRHGRVVRSRAPIGGKLTSIHVPDTIRAAALRGVRRAEARDVREAVKVGREANLVLFVVDASGSMAARQRMAVVKTAVLSLLRDAYQRRDKVGMVSFRGRDAELVLEPTASHEVGVVRLAELRTGGRTPLAAGLRRAARTLHGERRRDARRRPLLVVVTDGRSTSGPDPLTVVPLLAGVPAVVVDCESGPIRLGLARRLAAALEASCIPLSSLGA